MSNLATSWQPLSGFPVSPDPATTADGNGGDPVYVWTEVRERAVCAFGNQTPGAALEAEVIASFEASPAVVVAAIEDIGHRFARGEIRSAWGVLRTRLKDAAAGSNLIVVDASERERASARAETWIRAAGVHVDRESELLVALFEDPGERSGPVLGRWRDDELLREKMLELWRELRRKVAA